MLFLPLAALLAAGCGSAPATKSAADQRPLTTTLRHNGAFAAAQPVGTAGETQPESGSVLFLVRAHDSQPAPPRELYAVFRRPPRADDLEAQQRARDDALLDSVGDHRASGATASIGRPLYDDTRLVLGNVGRGVYALPTTKGAVCVGAFPNGGGGCATLGPHGLSVDYDDAADGLPFRLYGLVADEVRRVDVVLDGVTRQANLGENGYGLELADARWQQLHNLVLHLRSGATETVPLRP